MKTQVTNPFLDLTNNLYIASKANDLFKSKNFTDILVELTFDDRESLIKIFDRQKSKSSMKYLGLLFLVTLLDSVVSSTTLNTVVIFIISVSLSVRFIFLHFKLHSIIKRLKQKNYNE